jgi:pimeloyl-ACP methyl ester carboxylesterase
VSAPAETAVTVDTSELLVPGPWRHRFVAANGARFHVAELGEGPLVLLLHGFPQFWWAWRYQLPALAEAGYRTVAMDLRGYGASDKPPRGYDTGTLCADVAGVIKALGESRAVVIGHDWGGWVAWSMPALAPAVTRAIGVVSMGHPLQMRSASALRQWRASGYVLAFQVPVRPERWLTRGDGVRQVLRAWGGRGYPSPDAALMYQRAMRVPFVAHTSLEYFRWAVRSLPRRDGRRFAHALDGLIEVPVLQLHGGDDAIVRPESAQEAERWVSGPVRWQLLDGAGHFLPEERPGQVSAALVDWLAGLPRRSVPSAG